MKAINTDSILESGYIEQYIEDSPGSIFATIGFTEKPMWQLQSFWKGRVAIIVDGYTLRADSPALIHRTFSIGGGLLLPAIFCDIVRIIRVIAI
jgi:spore germination protein KA